MTASLSARLREGTKDSHRSAEHSPFIRKFFTGQLTRKVYAEFLLQLYFVYTALEQIQENHKGHATLGKIAFPELYRIAAIEEDLNFYFGNTDWKEIKPRQATQVYVQRINELSEQWVEGLVAHLYTRYLGDLSGGQALKKVVARSFDLATNEGIAFYEFSEITDIPRFKNEYRAQLDAMPLDDASAEKIVEEANRAFDLNRGVFDAMDE
ncbi:MAG: biliverdin-producing heme oxygenase [Calditrichaeota bacterium]|nr:MAG: biliverdin-producing heme oxygenase [Calditrichota bacterium]